MSTRDKSWYLAGPMQGYPQFNFPAFFDAANELRAFGHVIVSPAELDDREDNGAAMASPDGDISKSAKTWGTFLSRDVKIVADQVTGVVVLPNWYKSKGARLEVFVGLCAKKEFALYVSGKHTVGDPLLPVTADYMRLCLKENMP